MGADGVDQKKVAGSEQRATMSREDKRAASLRANLQRRKAQARGRAETGPRPADETKPPEAPGD